MSEKNPVRGQIGIFGLGYVGVTLGVVLADHGFEVLGVEPREKTIDHLKNGHCDIHEKGLPELLKKHANKNFKFFKDSKNMRATTYIVAVGTPVGPTKVPGLEYVKAVADSLGRILEPGNLIVLRSTVPVGTTRNFFIPLVEESSHLEVGKDFSVVFAPERTIEGSAITEITEIPQVIGGYDTESVQKAERIFRVISPQIVGVSSLEAAELVKLFNNTYRDVIFGFANEAALICDGFNVDPVEAIAAANEGYKRGDIPYPSPGVGGYCLTKDPHILLHCTRDLRYHPDIVFHARKVNDMMPVHVAEKVTHFLKGKKKALQKSKVFVLGMAFKGHPETTDIRFSPSVVVANCLQEKGINLSAHDPVVSEESIRLAGMQPINDLLDGFKNADCVIVMTNHMDYRKKRILRFLTRMNHPALFYDPWQLHDSKEVLAVTGVDYSNLGYDSDPRLAYMNTGFSPIEP
ncbi:MAG: nucleotide sugar dehydrogenase [Acidobacteriota bacterium]|nr:nucleotide sugar dehydrogenase [Acidobacteriota bacterium]